MSTLTETFEAVYRNEAFHPVEPVELAEGTRVRLGVEKPEATLRRGSTGADLDKHFGSAKSWGEDPLAFQQRLRTDWDDREKQRVSVGGEAPRE